MPKIIFAAISPHPPLILPSVGSEKDRVEVKATISSLEKLGQELKEKKPDSIVISSPHPDWGFDVPLFFLTKDFKKKITRYLIGEESPQFYFQEGKVTYRNLKLGKKYALIASGDLSHCLKEEGPYGFHSDGPQFDRALIRYLKEKDLQNLLKLGEKFPQAAECGLRSLCFLLGILEAHANLTGQSWHPQILSYEGPFGVGYLVVNFKL